MDLNEFGRHIAAGHYNEAMRSGEAVYRAVRPENFAPSSGEMALLCRAAPLIVPHFPALLLTAATELSFANPWIAVLIHCPGTRDGALQEVRVRIAGNHLATLTNICRIIDVSPPGWTAEFAPRLITLHTEGELPVRAYALRALGSMRHRGALELAAAALLSDEERMRRAVGVYFKYDRTPLAQERLIRAVREVDPAVPGWSLAVEVVSESGLLAEHLVPELLTALRTRTLPPGARAQLASCLCHVTLEAAVHKEALAALRIVLSGGIAKANERSVIPPETWEEAQKPVEPEVEACVRAFELVSVMPEPIAGLDDLAVEALRAKEWRIRLEAASFCERHSIPAAHSLPGLTAALEDALQAGKEDPSKMLPTATRSILEAILALRTGAAPAVTAVRRLAEEADQLNHEMIELAGEVLRGLE